MAYIPVSQYGIPLGFYGCGAGCPCRACRARTLGGRYIREGSDGDSDGEERRRPPSRPRPTAALGEPALTIASGQTPTRVPRAGRNPLDAKALAIIRGARDPTRPAPERAIETVWKILREYYPSEVSKVDNVRYVSNVPGLRATSVGRGPTARGIISVGSYFLTNTAPRYFARRVLQAGHELKHIDQWRAGLTGPANKAKREFLAHCWSAVTPEKPGTGCMFHATRVGYIDTALGNFYCLSESDQRRYVRERDELLALRQREQAASGRPAIAPPAACRLSL